MLTRDAKERSTGHEAGEMRAPRKEFGDERRRFDDVLEVVEDEQGILPLQEVRDPLHERAMASFPHVQRWRDRGEDQSWVTDGGQWHEPEPVREVAGDGLGHPQGESSLADTARAGEGHEADRVLAEEITQSCEFALSSDEGRC